MPRCELCRDRVAVRKHVELNDNERDEPVLDMDVCGDCVEYIGDIGFPAAELAKELEITPQQALVVRILLEEMDTVRRQTR